MNCLHTLVMEDNNLTGTSGVVVWSRGGLWRVSVLHGGLTNAIDGCSARLSRVVTPIVLAGSPPDFSQLASGNGRGGMCCYESRCQLRGAP